MNPRGLLFVLGCTLSLGCRRARRVPHPPRFEDIAARGADAPTVARPCAGCHRAQFEAWRRSQHAAAQRPAGEAREALVGGVTSRGVIGVAPLRQHLVATTGGRVQVFDPAFDVARGAWFSVFADARAPGAWGHWTGRGMNWNAQCAFCHTTRFAKGYDAATDTYGSTWDAVGIACAQCHGAMEGHPSAAPRDGRWRSAAADTCASCHARREELTGDFRAGERFDDHFRLALADTPDAYHPDGQAADEDFERGSLALSAMGHRGVTCLDCHDPHGGGLRAPIDRDQLCLTCHGGPGARGAPVISPSAHTHHGPTSAGSRCVACHMPEATFMQRDRRRDHGFTVPDPALAAELGFPDACGRCHDDLSPAARARAVDAWYGASMERPSRRRARLMARARSGDATTAPLLAAALVDEPNDAWRASFAGLLAPWAGTPAARAALARALDDRSPWVRAAAARALGEVSPEALARGFGDGLRVVRVDAAWAARGAVPWDRERRAEVLRWIEATSDQPAGALRRAELALREGRGAEARRWAERAVAWDPSAPTYGTLAQVCLATGDRACVVRARDGATRAAAVNGASGSAR